MPATPRRRNVLREIAASAARAAESAVAAAAAAQAAADAEEPPPPPKAMKRSTKSNVPPAPLSSVKRGAVVGIVAAATYGASKTYDWEDIVDLGEKIDSGALKLADVNNKDENGNWIHKVPYNTMRDWIKDDHVVMSAKKPPSVGVRGEPHWKVELEVRRRTSLKTPGGCGAGKQTVLGKVSGARQGAALVSPPSNTPPPPPPNARTRVVDPLVLHTRREVVVGLIRWRAHECSPVAQRTLARARARTARAGSQSFGCFMFGSLNPLCHPPSPPRSLVWRARAFDRTARSIGLHAAASRVGRGARGGHSGATSACHWGWRGGARCDVTRARSEAETVLMVDFGRMAQKGTPYLEEEIPDIIRLTAIELGVHDPVKHQPYTMEFQRHAPGRGLPAAMPRTRRPVRAEGWEGACHAARCRAERGGLHQVPR